MSKIFITGINGLDGSNLTNHLLSLGHDVHGMIRRHAWAESQDKRVSQVSDKIKTYYGDLTDRGSIDKIIKSVNPDYIINLAAMSHVRVSFEIPEYTLQTNCNGVFNMLESYRENAPHARFYQASSSECYGLSVNENGFQDENTQMNPVSPYGIAKVCGYNLVRHYRRAYGLFACNGLLFNHSGVNRTETFVEQKICRAAVEIKLGLCKTLDLGNLDSYRDIGNSKDYVRAMWMILNHSEPDDFVVSTMETHSIRNICEIVFGKLGLKWEDHVVIDKKNLRSEELPYLKGDSTKIRTTLGWKPEFSFEDTLDEMIQHWMDYFTKKQYF